MSKKYTDAQKAAYWKKRAMSGGGGSSKGLKAGKYSAAYAKERYAYKAAKQKTRAAEMERRRVRGPGFISEIGDKVGQTAGALVGSPMMGGFLGGKLGHLIEQITGFGDYRYSSNSIMSGCLQPAQVVNSVNKGGVIIRHREYLGDISATSAFTLSAYPINPGQAQTFPWLSGIAINFEQYKMRGLLFEFLSTSSDALLMSASSSALGTVNMATEYDSLDNNFGNKREMLNHEFSNSRKPSLSFIHPIECKRSRTPVTELYVRTGPIPPTADLRLYDLGKFQIATEGMQSATGVCGELWVTYEVELYKAKYDTGLVNEGLTDHFKLVTPVGANPCGTSSFRTATSSLGGVLGGAAGNVYSFPSTVAIGDVFLVTWTVAAINNAVIAYPPLSTAACIGQPIYGTLSPASPTFYAPASGSTANACSMQIMIQIIGAGATMSWGTTGVLPGTSSYGDLIVTQVQTGLTAKPAVEEVSEDEVEVETPQYTDEYVKQLEEQVVRLRKLERKPTV